MNNTTQQRFQRNRTSDFKQYLGFDKKFGYLHEIREIQTQNSKTYTARIAVPIGQGDRMNYVNFELYIKSADALIVFLSHHKAIDDENTKVTVRFSCGNTHPRAYIAKSGVREGQAVPYLGGNLMYLHTMKIDGVVVHGYTQDNNADDDTSVEEIDKETGEVLTDGIPVTEHGNTAGEIVSLHGDNVQSEPDLPQPLPVEAYENELESMPSVQDERSDALSPETSAPSKSSAATKDATQSHHTAKRKTSRSKGTRPKAS